MGLRICAKCGKEVDAPFCPYCNSPTPEGLQPTDMSSVPAITEAETFPAFSLDAPYEFSAVQNREFERLTANMRAVSYMLLFLGVLVLLPGVVAARVLVRLELWRVLLILLVGSVGPGLILLLYGALNLRSAAAFHRITRTRGGDLGHLMSAVASLREMYFVTALLLLAGLGLSAVNLWRSYLGR